jgi:hypothetical protein
MAITKARNYFPAVKYGAKWTGADIVVDSLSTALSRASVGVGAQLDDRTRVIYVDRNAGGAGDGTSWEDAYTTIQAGINAARYNYGTTTISYDDEYESYVFVAPGNYSSEGRIAFSAKNLHLIGLGQPGTDTGVTIRPSSPSTFAFGGSGTGVEIANIGIFVDSAVIGLYWEQMDGNCWFHDLYIYGNSSNATYGIYTGGLKGGSTISDCKVSGFVTSGIYVAGGADMYFTDGKIVWNQIGATATCATAIYVSATTTVSNALIAHNYIIGDNFTKTIDIDATAADVLMADNLEYAAGEGGTARDNHTT